MWTPSEHYLSTARRPNYVNGGMGEDRLIANLISLDDHIATGLATTGA